MVRQGAMIAIAPRSRLFHAIVVVGLSTASAGCGASGRVVAKDEGDAASGPPPADAVAADAVGMADATSEDGSEFFSAQVPLDDAAAPTQRSDASDVGADCPLGEQRRTPGGQCWPIYV